MDLNSQYFDWLCKMAEPESNGYTSLMRKLYDTEFIYSIELDRNRVEDGLALRDIFAQEFTGEDKIHWNRYSEYLEVALGLNDPCNLLEVMLGMARRLETNIMTDDDYGDRTHEWFWIMIRNLGLDGESDTSFDEQYVEEVIDILLNRKYSYTGEGSMFPMDNHQGVDMRTVDLWYQMMWYFARYYTS